MTLRAAVYSPDGLAVGFVTQRGNAYYVELLGADGFARETGNYDRLLPAVLHLLDETRDVRDAEETK